MIRWFIFISLHIGCGQASVAAKEVKPVPTEAATQEPTAPKEDEAPPKEKDVKPRPLSPYAA